MPDTILHVAIPVPLRRQFDYLPGPQFTSMPLSPGMRLSVPFGKRQQQVGLLLALTQKTAVPRNRLKSINTVIDPAPLFDKQQLELLLWASQYYQHPVGEVVFAALPGLLRQGKPAERKSDSVYVSTTDRQTALASLQRAPKQRQVFNSIIDRPKGISQAELSHQHGNIHQPLLALLKKRLIKKVPPGRDTNGHQPPPVTLNPDQSAAVKSITQEMSRYHARLLQGITGSGKTEVYIEAIRKVIARGKQALVLVPEISLTPQFLERLQARLPVSITSMHSGLGRTARLHNWLAARQGEAQVIIGTRSAVWTPLKNPGVFIIDEEHDSSYKQEEGFRYSARDVAIMRAQMAGVPVVLGSATPSLESIHNVQTGKFKTSCLPQRVGTSSTPEIRLVNLQNQQITGAFSTSLLQAIKANLINGQQTLLFLNRRGHSPAILCHHCGWLCGCERCSINMTWHKEKQKLVCHHCDKQQALPDKCRECGGMNLIKVGHGTQRISQTISEHFPEANILRIDKDSTRRCGSMDAMLQAITSGQAQILIGTQMLAKGHHFPNVTLVGIIDADSGLLSADFRATERMAQLIIQVSGRAGRAETKGTVYIQTHYPNHPLLQALVHKGYSHFAQSLLAEREQALLPPYSFIALLRAEAKDKQLAVRFLDFACRSLGEQQATIQLSGPYAAPIEKKQGRYRYQLVLQTHNRAVFKSVLADWLVRLENSAPAQRVRWSLDIDPQDML